MTHALIHLFSCVFISVQLLTKTVKWCQKWILSKGNADVPLYHSEIIRVWRCYLLSFPPSVYKSSCGREEEIAEGICLKKVSYLKLQNIFLYSLRALAIQMKRRSGRFQGGREMKGDVGCQFHQHIGSSTVMVVGHRGTMNLATSKNRWDVLPEGLWLFSSFFYETKLDLISNAIRMSKCYKK